MEILIQKQNEKITLKNPLFGFFSDDDFGGITMIRTFEIYETRKELCYKVNWRKRQMVMCLFSRYTRNRGAV